MKNAAKPRGVFPRTSVEKNCLNASLAITSMGLDADGAAGETRVLIDSSGTLVLQTCVECIVWLPKGCPSGIMQQLCPRNACCNYGSPGPTGRGCAAALLSLVALARGVGV